MSAILRKLYFDLNNNASCVKGLEQPFNKKITVTDHILKSAEKYPDNIALIDSNVKTTYRELTQKIELIANNLIKLGINKSDVVSLYMEPSNDLVMIVLALLKVGAVYLVIDTTYPHSRAEYLIDNARTKYLVTDINSFSVNIKTITTVQKAKLFSQPPKYPFQNAPKKNKTAGDDPAYIIYTSGSTGTPKGITVAHKSINNHMLWMIDNFLLTQKDRFLLKTPMSFDPSIWEMLLPLYIGATLVIADPGTHIKPKKLLRYVDEYNITILQLVPAILFQTLLRMRPNELDSLRYLFVGGESLTQPNKKLFFEKKLAAKLVNLYGPAECTIDSSYHIVKNCQEDIEHNYIGSPIYNTCIHILNSDEKICEIGEIGEICISGDALSAGYIDKHKNRDKFIEVDAAGECFTLYKTGDLGKRTLEGPIEYIGRVDSQHKINGVRVEAEEIKFAILKHPGVNECFIDVEKNEEYQYSELIAYLVTEEHKEINPNTLKEFLKNDLPNFMIPSSFYIIKKPPLTENGKLDYKALKGNAIKLLPPYKNQNSELSGIEATLSKIWSEIINIPIKIIDKHSNFYELGGSSITSMLLMNEIEKIFPVNFMLGDLLESQTIEQQSELIAKKIYFPEQESRNQASNTILSLNNSCDTEIFLVHPIGGMIFWYLELSKLLNNSIHILGINDPGVLIGKEIFSSIEDMAAAYVKSILEFPTKKSYILGGASFGATIAIEMARLLQNHGLSIESVLVLDGWAIYPNELRDPNYFHASMQKQQSLWGHKIISHGSDAASLETIFKVQMHRLDLLFNYKMKEINFHLDIFKARETLPIFQEIDNKYNHWDKFSSNFNCYTIPGNHESMFDYPNVLDISNILLKNHL